MGGCGGSAVGTWNRDSELQWMYSSGGVLCFVFLDIFMFLVYYIGRGGSIFLVTFHHRRGYGRVDIYEKDVSSTPMLYDMSIKDGGF